MSLEVMDTTHQLLSNAGTQQHVLSAGIDQDHQPMACAHMAESFCLAPRSASRILPGRRLKAGAAQRATRIAMR